MVDLNTLVEYIDELLDVSQFRDYCPNGLQVQGKAEVKRVVGGVTASLDLIEEAVTAGADAILVHHGYFWKGESQTITGMKYQRIKRLLEAGISLLGYHLPLDAHSVYGNNAQLAVQLGLQREGGFASHGKVDIASFGRLADAISIEELGERITNVLKRPPLMIKGHDRPICRIGWCSGAAQGYIDEAAALGLDAYLSGEVSEHTFHAARELGIDFIAAGHHATERYGVLALGRHLSEHFDLEFSFTDLENPV